MKHAPHHAPPAAVRPRPRPVHTVRALRARRRRGVTLIGRPRIGRGVRLRVAPGARLTLGDGCVIGDGCSILVRAGEVRVQAGATLGDRCTVVAHVGIEIGAAAVIGDGAMIVDFDHGFADVERPIRLQPIAVAAVRVGDRASIGHGACLLRGVTVGQGAVIGAHAVVTHDVRPGERAGGVPAARIPGSRERSCRNPG